MNHDTKQEMLGSLAWGLGIVVLALAGKYAQKQGFVDGDMVTRLVIGTTGLMIAWMGNRMPKAFVPSACGRRVRRVGGWSLALSGLVYAGLFAFAPLDVAYVGGSTAVLVGVAVTLGYCLLLRARTTTA